MHTLTLSDQELRLLHNALETWIYSFSHEQPELLREGKQLRARLDAEIGSPVASGDMPRDSGFSPN